MNCQYYDFSRPFCRFYLLIIYIHLAVWKQNDIKILIEQKRFDKLEARKEATPILYVHALIWT